MVYKVNSKEFINICIDTAISEGFEDPESAFWQCNRFSQAVYKVAKIFNIKNISLYQCKAEWQTESGDAHVGYVGSHVFLKVGSSYVDFTHRQIKNDTEFPFVFKKIPKYFTNVVKIEHEILGDEQDDVYIYSIIKKLMKKEGLL